MKVVDALPSDSPRHQWASGVEPGGVRTSAEVRGDHVATAIYHPSFSYRLGLASEKPPDMLEIEDPDSYQAWLKQPGARLLIAFSFTCAEWELVALASECREVTVVSLLPAIDIKGYIRALTTGVDGVALADQHPSLIWRVVEASLTGEVVLPMDIAKELAYGHSRVRRQPCPLSEDEIQLLSLCASGNTVDEIAGSVHYGPRSVRRKLERITRKLGAATRAHAVHLATRSHWV